LLPVTLVAAIGAPVYALLLVTVASNKVEGLAVAKALGIMMAAPFAGYLLKSPLSLMAGLLPPFWPTMAIVMGYNRGSAFWLYVLAGTAVHLAWLAALHRIFDKRKD